MGIDAEMYVVTQHRLNEDQIIEISYDLGAAFGSKRFYREESTGKYRRAHHNMSEVDKIEQDGPDWLPPKGSYLYRLHLLTRYYGPGYERGDLSFLVMLAEWLEARLPKCEIMYGGDSSGVCAEPWGPKERRKMIRHFASPSGRAYFGALSAAMGGSGDVPVCPMCGGRPLTQVMWGGGAESGRAGFVCYGCGRRVLRDGAGKFHRLHDHSEGWEVGP